MFSFIISTVTIFVIPVTSVNQPIIYLTIHSPIIIIIIVVVVVVVNVVTVIFLIVKSLKIIFKNFYIF